MLYRDHTVSLCGTHTVQVGGAGGRAAGGRAGGSRATPTPHWGFPVPAHTSKIAIPQLRGDELLRTASDRVNRHLLTHEGNRG